MTQSKRPREISSFQYLHEALFAFNVGFFAMTVAFANCAQLAAVFSRMESSLNMLLGIRQTDYIRGYFAISIPSLILGCLLWAALRFSGQTRFSEEILRSVAGLFALFAVPAFWIYQFQSYGWPFGWPYRGAPFELAAAVLCAILLKRGRWRFPWWFAFPLLAGHYIFFWLWVGGNYAMPNYAGPIAPILSFCSGVAWACYIRRLPPPEMIHGVLEKEPVRI